MVFYATSNRRHLMPREMMDNEQGTAIFPARRSRRKVSLSDRFGLWIGFHNCSQAEYTGMVQAYADHYRLGVAPDRLAAEALVWAMTRGSRSGRVAWQYIQDLACRLGLAGTVGATRRPSSFRMPPIFPDAAGPAGLELVPVQTRVYGIKGFAKAPGSMLRLNCMQARVAHDNHDRTSP